MPPSPSRPSSADVGSKRFRSTQKIIPNSGKPEFGMRGGSYACSPCCIMQERCLWSCWTPQVDWVIFPDSPLQSRNAFSRVSLMSPSARCAKLGVASAERASPAANPTAMHLFPRTMVRSPSSFSSVSVSHQLPRTRRQRALQEIVECSALHVGKSAGRGPQERSKNCHAQTGAVECRRRAVRGRAQCCHTSCCRGWKGWCPPAESNDAEQPGEQRYAPGPVRDRTDELIALLREQLAEMRTERDQLREDAKTWRAAFEEERAQRALPAPGNDAQGPETTPATPAEQPSRLRRAWRWMRATGCLAGACLLVALSMPAGAQSEQQRPQPQQQP